MSNVTPPIDPQAPPKHFVNYNQDSTSLVVGSKAGYRLYSLSNVDDLELIYSNDVEETYMVERLFSSSLVATVSLAAPRKLKVCHFKKGTEICNYSYSNTILAVRMNRSRLVVCLEESLYIHNIRDMKVLHTIRDTPPNPQGLCALSISHDNCLLAYPGSATIGEVQIFDAHHLHAKTMVPAHDSPLAALAFNPTGTKLATASEKGTVIRVFSALDGIKLFEFRRGVKRCVDISSLAFSMCGQFLCCSSNTETVHVFKFEAQSDSPKPSTEEGSWMGYLSSYLPTQVTDVFTQGRAFATAHLPIYGVKNVISIVLVQNQLRLLVATQEAVLYVYNLDPNGSGDLELFKQHHLGESKSAKGTTSSEAQTIDEGCLNNNCWRMADFLAFKNYLHSGVLPSPNPDTVFYDSGSKLHFSGSAILGSYAGIVKGNPLGEMSGTESDKLREMASATESPPKGAFHFGDLEEYPPLTQNSD